MNRQQTHHHHHAPPDYNRAFAIGVALNVVFIVVEVVFGLYLLVSCVLLVSRGHLWGAPINLLVAGGFLFLGMGTLRKRWAPRRTPSTGDARPVSIRAG